MRQFVNWERAIILQNSSKTSVLPFCAAADIIAMAGVAKTLIF